MIIIGGDGKTPGAALIGFLKLGLTAITMTKGLSRFLKTEVTILPSMSALPTAFRVMIRFGLS